LEYINSRNDLDDADIFILFQATSPFTEKKDIEGALSIYLNGEYNSIVTCSRQKRFIWDEKGNPVNYDFNKRPRRQDFDGFLVENGAFYINSIGKIKKDKNRLSAPVGIWEMAPWKSVEIDEIEDWLTGEILFREKLSTVKVNKTRIKLFFTDVDGVLTDAGMYYNQTDDEFKKFNTRDGKGFALLKNQGIKTGIITSENTIIVNRRANKLNVDYLFQDINDKLSIVKTVCKEEKIHLSEVAYIGDDLNDIELLRAVGLAACPNDAVEKVKEIPNIIQLKKNGGDGVVREFIESYLLF
jgi:N-acylneuraminate cytidylyltransferase